MSDEAQQRANRAFGAVVRRLREERKLTQEQLAWTCGMSRVYLSETERGLREPCLGMILRLSASLDVKASELIEALEVEIAVS